ncbi:MAG: o-succinylbenzoate synthase [Snowella sp.]|nr:o-succinylbenzoate synthase [Snowella sp.]
MRYQFQFSPYRRPFKVPLQTHHGIWSVREGIIIQLRNSDNQLYLGEIAPLADFGSENLAQALDFCQSLGSIVDLPIITTIPDSLPACQFGFESAFFLGEISPLSPQSYSYLLPTGKKAVEVINQQRDRGYKTYKWKIGVQDFKIESSVFKQLVSQLPENAQLRLDANGGLSFDEAKRWLSLADEVGKIEFIEQPLPPERFFDLFRLTEEFKTAIALDESVSSLPQLQQCYEQGWRGIYVIKAAIMGSPTKLQNWIQTHPIDVVFSSVFETRIGRQAVLKLAQELHNPNRALGFGVEQWFEDSV